MEKKEVKATITLAGQTHEIYISQARAKQIKRFKKLIKEERAKKGEQATTTSKKQPKQSINR